jgi:hypothetical protein
MKTCDLLYSDTSFLDDLVRECSGEADNSALGRGVVEQLKISKEEVGAQKNRTYLGVTDEWVLKCQHDSSRR